MLKGKNWIQVTRADFVLILCFRLHFGGTPGEELSKEEKNLAIMAMKKKDELWIPRIMHSKKKLRSEVNYFSGFFFLMLWYLINRSL